MTTRDTQRSKVYAAEYMLRDIIDLSAKAPTFEVFGSTILIPSEIRFSTLEHIQVYVDHVLSHSEVIATFGKHPDVVVRKRRGNSKAHYIQNQIFIHAPENQTTWAMRESVVLHEVAHHLMKGYRHGPEFVGALLSLLEIFLGPEARLIYLSCLEGSGAVWSQTCQHAQKVSA